MGARPGGGRPTRGPWSSNQEPPPVSHVTPSHAARATDHAVRRYLERVHRLDLGGPTVPDPEALSRARAQG